MGIDRSEDRCGKRRMNNRSTCGKGIGGGTCGRGNDESVRVERRQIFPFYPCMQIDEARDRSLRNDCFIEGIAGEDLFLSAMRFYREDTALFDDAASTKELRKNITRFMQLDFCKKSYRSAVYAHNRNGKIFQLSHGSEDRSVSANDEEQIYVTRTGVRGQILSFRNIVLALRIEKNLRAKLPKNRKNLGNGLGLIL